MQNLKAQVRALVHEHGVIVVLSAVKEVCQERLANGSSGNEDLSWKMAEGLLRRATEQLGKLIDVPGITEPIPYKGPPC